MLVRKEYCQQICIEGKDVNEVDIVCLEIVKDQPIFRMME